MTVHTCDKCSATISQEYSFLVGIGIFYKVELCKACAKPLIAFLADNNMLQDKLREYGFVADTAQAASECEPILG